eukprot:2257627-Amphidinium_carterae.2
MFPELYAHTSAAKCYLSRDDAHLYIYKTVADFLRDLLEWAPEHNYKKKQTNALCSSSDSAGFYSNRARSKCRT